MPEKKRRREKTQQLFLSRRRREWSEILKYAIFAKEETQQSIAQRSLDALWIKNKTNVCERVKSAHKVSYCLFLLRIFSFRARRRESFRMNEYGRPSLFVSRIGLWECKFKRLLFGIYSMGEKNTFKKLATDSTIITFYLYAIHVIGLSRFIGQQIELRITVERS